MSRSALELPAIIQGGMGVAISDWRLANAVARSGGLGVVSGTALDSVMIRRLQNGDAGGHVRRALEAFPVPDIAGDILGRFFRQEGRRNDETYRRTPMYRAAPHAFRDAVTVAANFVEVWLAREGHDRPVGINYLTKVQLPTLPSLFGAMLAGVHVVLMGAGIPLEIPDALEALSEGREATIRIHTNGEPLEARFDPGAFGVGSLERPLFLPIVSSASLASILLKKTGGRVDGFVVESPLAGGHNAPPRGRMQLDERGQPMYGERDAVASADLRELSVPFWLAGDRGHAGALRAALAEGAQGIQIGSLFACCDESGMEPSLRTAVIARARQGDVGVFTDPVASPTGFPFKIVHLEGTLSDETVYAERERLCDLGYLREVVRLADGTVAYRCAAEPVDDYVAKGGRPEDAEGRRCLCNALMATAGMGQHTESGRTEPPVVTGGDALADLGAFLNGRDTYTAADVMAFLNG